MKINSLADLKQERELLNMQSKAIVETLKGDVDLIKNSLNPLAIISRILPESILLNKLIRVPLNFIEKKLGQRNQDRLKPDPATEKNTRIRGIALNVLEATTSVLLSRYLGKKF